MSAESMETFVESQNFNGASKQKEKKNLGDKEKLQKEMKKGMKVLNQLKLLLRGAVLIKIAVFSGHRPLQILTHLPPPYWSPVARHKKYSIRSFFVLTFPVIFQRKCYQNA